MLQFDPAHRLSMAEVKAHPWVNGPVSTLEGIQQDFVNRKALIDQENEAKRIAKEQERQAQLAQAGVNGRRQYRNVTAHRGDAEREGDEESKHEVRTLD
jgi:multidrug resistance efflux pump